MSAPNTFVRKIKTGNPFAKLVLKTLSDYANWTTGLCFPSIETIAEDCECSESTARRRLKELQKLGLITIQKRIGNSHLFLLVGYAEWYEKHKNDWEKGGVKSEEWGVKHDKRGVPQQGVSNAGGCPVAHEGVSHSPKGGVPLTPEIYNITYNRNISFEENKKEMEKELSGLSNEEVKVEIRENRIFLCKHLKEKWLQLFNNNEQDLELALVQILPYLQNRNPVQLEVQVSSQLSRICRERRERDARYANSTKKEKKPFTPSRWGINYD